MFVCDVSSAITQLFQVAQPLMNCPISDIQIVSKKLYQSLLGDRQKAYEIGLGFTHSQSKLICTLETTQKELNEKSVELDKLLREMATTEHILRQKTVELKDLRTQYELQCKRGKQDLAMSVGALLKEQDGGSQAVGGLKKIIADLKKELEQYRPHEIKHEIKHEHSDNNLNISTLAEFGEVRTSRKRQRTGSPAEHPHNKQSNTLRQLVLESQTILRTVYIKFTRHHRGIDEMMSEIIPGCVESVYWNTPAPGHRFAFVNFISRPDAQQFLTYINQNPTHLPVGLTVEWGLKPKPMTLAVVEAIIDRGATRILHITEVPIETQHSDIWRMSGKTTFRFIRVIRKHEHSVDIALEFNSVEDALQAKKTLAGAEQLRECRFVWGKNVTDHLVEGFVRMKGGNGRVFRV